MSFDASFWIAVSFCIFWLMLFVPKKVRSGVLFAVDSRIALVRADIGRAVRLQEEAESLLHEWEKRADDVDSRVQEIVEQARLEAEKAAENIITDAKLAMNFQVKAVNERVAMAKAQAVRKIRERAVLTAVAAASDLAVSCSSEENMEAAMDSALSVIEGNLRSLVLQGSITL